MTNRPFLCHITGNPNVTTLTKVNVRAQPGTAVTIAVQFQIDVAAAVRNVPILEVQSDLENKGLNSKVFQWFRVRFTDGREGWVRDDLVTIEGDGTKFGYPNITQAAYGFSFLRQRLPTATPSPTPSPPVMTPTPSPAPSPTPPTTPTPPVAPAPAPVPVPSTQLTATVIGRDGLNLRDAPVSGKILSRLAFREKVTIIGAQPQAGTQFIWAQVQAAAGTGWARTDFLSISGDGTRFGLSKGDEYPSPLQNYWWSRGQNDVRPDGSVDEHLGWDFGLAVGEVVRCGPNGGKVVRLLSCQTCTNDRPNGISQGIKLNDPRIFTEAWGFGYGNAPIVRYLNEHLPASTRERLTAQGKGGSHLYVIYGHLSTISVQAGQDLAAFAQIGLGGNTGNSDGAHLHLEVRSSTNPNVIDWSSMRANVIDPKILFVR